MSRVLPPPELIKLSDVGKMLVRIPSDIKLIKPDINKLDEWLTTKNDHILQDIFNPRTKNDLAIRRTRSLDLISYAIKTKTTAIITLLTKNLSTDFDYITVLNLCWAAVLYPKVWLANYLKWNILVTDLHHLLTTPNKYPTYSKQKSVLILTSFTFSKITV